MKNVLDKVLQEIDNDEIVITSNDKCNDGISIHTCINRKKNTIEYIEIYDVRDVNNPTFVLSISTTNPSIQIPFDIFNLVYKNRCKLANSELGIYILDNTIEIFGASDEIIPYEDNEKIWEIVKDYLSAYIVQESIQKF